MRVQLNKNCRNARKGKQERRMKSSKLLDEIKASGMNVAEFAERLGISESTVYRKLKSGNFLVGEAVRASEILGLNADEASSIFFEE